MPPNLLCLRYKLKQKPKYKFFEKLKNWAVNRKSSIQLYAIKKAAEKHPLFLMGGDDKKLADSILRFK